MALTWTDGLFDNFSTAVSDTLGSLSDSLVDSIFDRFILWAFNMIYEGLIALLTNINEMGAEIFDLDWCQLLMRLFAVLGGAFFVVGMFVSFFDLGISYQSQQGGADPMNTFLNCVKGFVAAFLFVNIPVELYRFCVSLQNSVSRAILALAGQDSTMQIGDYAQQALSQWMAGTSVISIFPLFILIAFAYCIIKVFFGNLKRGGILLALIAIGSVHMFSVPRGYSDGFTSWCKQVIGLCVTAFLQTTFLFAGLLTFVEHPLLGTGVMLSAAEVPRILEKFGLDTSTRGNAMQAVYGTSMVMTMVRFAK